MLSGYRHYPDNMQVGYDEGLLSADGETLIQRKMHCVQGAGPLRFAVYLHFYDPRRLVQWQAGEVSCPPVEEVPIRLTDADAVPRLQLKLAAAYLNEWHNVRFREFQFPESHHARCKIESYAKPCSRSSSWIYPAP